MCLWGLCFLHMFLKHQKCNSTNSHVLRFSFISRILQHSDWNFKDAFSLIENNIKDKLNEIKRAVVTLLIDVLYSVKASLVLFTELRRISDLLHPTSDRNPGALMHSSQWFCHRVHRHWLSFISPSLGSQCILHRGITIQIEPFKWSTSLKVRYLLKLCSIPLPKHYTEVLLWSVWLVRWEGNILLDGYIVILSFSEIQIFYFLRWFFVLFRIFED